MVLDSNIVLSALNPVTVVPDILHPLFTYDTLVLSVFVIEELFEVSIQFVT